jgi:hypothetical protein
MVFNNQALLLRRDWMLWRGEEGAAGFNRRNVSARSASLNTIRGVGWGRSGA